MKAGKCEMGPEANINFKFKPPKKEGDLADADVVMVRSRKGANGSEDIQNTFVSLITLVKYARENPGKFMDDRKFQRSLGAIMRVAEAKLRKKKENEKKKTQARKERLDCKKANGKQLSNREPSELLRCIRTLMRPSTAQNGSASSEFRKNLKQLDTVVDSLISNKKFCADEGAATQLSSGAKTDKFNLCHMKRQFLSKSELSCMNVKPIAGDTGGMQDLKKQIYQAKGAGGKQGNKGRLLTTANQEEKAGNALR